MLNAFYVTVCSYSEKYQKMKKIDIIIMYMENSL